MKEAVTLASEGSQPPAVRLDGICKRFAGKSRRLKISPWGFYRSFVQGEFWETVALNNVSFSVDHGEVFGLLGPNGSGKTTMIKILSNLVIPDGGAAYVEGINVVRRPYAATARLQTVLADPLGMERRISARQNLLLFASLYNLPRSEAKEKIDRLLDYFDLTKYADKASQSLSTGMSRKLSVCRVLLSDASVIVFDEPTSGMDPVSADSFRKLILDDLVKREKKTIVMATHNLVEATSMCNRIALLNKGKLLAVGSPQEIRRTVEDNVEVTLELSGESSARAELQEQVKLIDGVRSAEVRTTHGGTEIKLNGRKDLDYLALLSLVSRSGLRVHSLETTSASLEDAFLRLTSQADK
jgi:ABC-2 type transport system ATP-binding protein